MNCQLVGPIYVGKCIDSYGDSIHGLKQVNPKSLPQNCYLFLLHYSTRIIVVTLLNHSTIVFSSCNNNKGKQQTIKVTIFNYALHV
jgi:hypothetical protein